MRIFFVISIFCKFVRLSTLILIIFLFNCASGRLSSSEEEKENKVNERSRRNKIKAQIFETDEDESPGTARKRKKVSNDVEEGSEETKQIVNRNLVIEKFKEIWKMLLITTEVGLKWSKNRLEILSNPDRGKIIDDLGKEYKHLQSVAAMLSSSISKATDSIEALKDDLTCKNGRYEFLVLVFCHFLKKQKSFPYSRKPWTGRGICENSSFAIFFTSVCV